MNKNPARSRSWQNGSCLLDHKLWLGLHGETKNVGRTLLSGNVPCVFTASFCELYDLGRRIPRLRFGLGLKIARVAVGLPLNIVAFRSVCCLSLRESANIAEQISLGFENSQAKRTT